MFLPRAKWCVMVVAGLLFTSAYVWGNSLWLPTSERQKININQDWQYHKGDIVPFPIGKTIAKDSWEQVSLPHTYQLTSINLDDSTDDKFQATFHRDVSWYRRHIQVLAKPGQRVYLEFEGAHQKTDLWVNGEHVGQHAVSAYTPFHFDITSQLKLNQDNLITVRLDNRKDPDIPPDGHSQDYILFGGLYRDVYLVVKDQLHIGFPWESREAGVFVTTPSVSEKSATVLIRTQVKNLSEQGKTFTLLTRILDADNRVVQTLEKQASLKADSAITLLQAGSIDDDVHLWSIDRPYLYRVSSQVLFNGKVVDSVDNPLGLRWIEHRLGQGVLLNGKPIELIGANRHQHYPYIGDAVPNNLHRSDAIKFKQAGMNIVRLAHYPHDNAFIQACDELGLLIAEEPPTWIEFGTPLWMDRLEESTRRMIRNHRNHPSIWGWGAGINHRGPVKRLHYAAKEEDVTRVTMNNGTVWTGPQHSGVTDIYAVMDYRGAVRPEKELLFAIEHTNTPDALSLQTIVSRYKGDANLIGLASWSAHESHSFVKRDERYPNLSRWEASSWDSFRSPKPLFYWYQSELTEPAMVHIADSRGQNAGSVNIFTNTDEVELFHNGQSLGRKKPEYTLENQHINSPVIVYPFDWQSGELVVKGYRDKTLVAEHKRVKANQPDRLKLVWDLDGFDYYADGSSIVVGFAQVLDSQGNQVEDSIQDNHVEGSIQDNHVEDSIQDNHVEDSIQDNHVEDSTQGNHVEDSIQDNHVEDSTQGNHVEDSTLSVQFELSGPGQIVGDASIGANPVMVENGLAPVLVRVGKQPGEIQLTATANGLRSDTVSLTTRHWNANELQRTARPIIEPLRLKVDLGNTQQHVQETWSALSVDNGASVGKLFTIGNGKKIRVTVNSIEGDISWENTWGVPGDLSFMIEDGAAVSVDNQLQLSFSHLPAGKYQLKTWHHILSAEKAMAPALDFFALQNSQQIALLSAYQPTFGRQVTVSVDGDGDKGDGGSNKGAAGYALHIIDVDDSGNFTLTISSQASLGTIRLTGFDLEQVVTQ